MYSQAGYHCGPPGLSLAGEPEIQCGACHIVTLPGTEGVGSLPVFPSCQWWMGSFRYSDLQWRLIKCLQVDSPRRPQQAMAGRSWNDKYQGEVGRASVEHVIMWFVLQTQLKAGSWMPSPFWEAGWGNRNKELETIDSRISLALIPSSANKEPCDCGKVSRHKKKWAIKPQQGMEKPLVCISKWKKKIRKGSSLHNSNNMTFWKRQNYGENKKASGYQGLARRWRGK